MKAFKIIGVLLILAIVSGAVWFIFFRKKERQISLETTSPHYGYIARSVTATGTVEPVDTVSVGTQVSGIVKNIYADYNSKVKKGQLIAELDKSLLLAAANQYSANLELVKSQFVYQKSNFERQSILYNTGAISKQDYETAQFNYNSATASVRSVQAQLDAANKNLSYTNIYSPVDGVVMMRNVSIGQTVAASFNTPTLFIIAKDITKMEVQGAVDEADIGNVMPGQRVSFTVDAYPDDVFEGLVSEIRLHPTVSANVVTYPTIISAPNQNMKLKPGMTANITVYTKEDSNALLIPSRAFKFQPDNQLVKQYKIAAHTMDTSGRRKPPVMDTSKRGIRDSAGPVKRTRALLWIRKGDSLIQKRVITGLVDDANTEVLYGLKPEDEVVTGIESKNASPGASAGNTQRSPFMPTRRSSTPARTQTGGNR